MRTCCAPRASKVTRCGSSRSSTPPRPRGSRRGSTGRPCGRCSWTWSRSRISCTTATVRSMRRSASTHRLLRGEDALHARGRVTGDSAAVGELALLQRHGQLRRLAVLEQRGLLAGDLEVVCELALVRDDERYRAGLDRLGRKCELERVERSDLHGRARRVRARGERGHSEAGERDEGGGESRHPRGLTHFQIPSLVRPWTRTVLPQFHRLGRVLRAAAIVLFLVFTVAQVAAASNGSWPTANGDLSSRRATDATVIGARTAAHLRVLWRFHLPQRGAFGAVTANPVISGRTVYVQDSSSAVYALDARAGALRWKRPFAAPNDGPNGVAVSGGRVFGATDTSAFALDAATGRRLWARRLANRFEQFVGIAPIVDRGRVYVSTQGFAPGGRGAVYALAGRTG